MSWTLALFRSHKNSRAWQLYDPSASEENGAQRLMQFSLRPRLRKGRAEPEPGLPFQPLHEGLATQPPRPQAPSEAPGCIRHLSLMRVSAGVAFAALISHTQICWRHLCGDNMLQIMHFYSWTRLQIQSGAVFSSREQDWTNTLVPEPSPIALVSGGWGWGTVGTLGLHMTMLFPAFGEQCPGQNGDHPSIQEVLTFKYYCGWNISLFNNLNPKLTSTIKPKVSSIVLHTGVAQERNPYQVSRGNCIATKSWASFWQIISLTTAPHPGCRGSCHIHGDRRHRCKHVVIHYVS